MKKDIRDLTLGELKALMKNKHVPSHRARQIFQWLYDKKVSSFVEMTNLPKTLITGIETKFAIVPLECADHKISTDRTEKILWRLSDGEHIETVLIREGKRNTICLSTQVGCKFACAFCASGMKKFHRNLLPSEILGQLIQTEKMSGGKTTNVVFMGMGEPLDNYDNLMKAVRVMNDPDALGIGARKITVSTCGIAPAILKLKDEGIQLELSVSLHATTDEVRNKLVPINRKYPIGELMRASEEYRNTTGRIVTIEYALIKDMNDSRGNAERLADIARSIRAKVNLIACNPFENLPYEGPDIGKIKAFQETLSRRGVTVTLRRSRGREILAACGQLAAQKKAAD
jgi:23S rRNA (adenine2503-C2)-methyltransferase